MSENIRRYATLNLAHFYALAYKYTDYGFLSVVTEFVIL